MSAHRITVIAALSVGALSAPVAAAPTGQTVQLHNYGFSPAPITLAAGKEVQITFVNASKKSHDFSAKEFFAASRIASGDVKDGEVELKGGESKTVALVPAAGTYEAHCSHPFHSAFGMHTKVIVR
jgi:plastocyanin